MKRIVKFIIACTIISSCNKNEGRFDATGTFEAREIIVSSQVSGTIEQLDVQEGSTVDSAQFLGWIDSTQLHLKKKQLQAQINAILSKRPRIATQLASYRVQLAAAERELTRLTNLYNAEAATQKQVDDARAGVAVIKKQIEAHRSSLDISTQGIVSETLPLSVQVEQLEDQLTHFRIVNPVKGTILNQYAEVHELVTPGKPLYKVADLSSLDLRAYVTGSQLPTLKLNQEVRVFVDNGSGGHREYTGPLTWISGKAEFTPKTIQTKEERADLVYAVKVRVRNDGYLKIGMYGEVRF